MGLVDYAGSDSDSEQEEQTTKKVEDVPAKPVLADGESFFDDETKNIDSSNHFNMNKEDVLDEIVKPKDWELKMAEKAKRKMEKKAVKKALKKEKKLAKKARKEEKIAKVPGGGVQKKEKAKIVISALGSLPGIAGDSDDSDDDDKEVFSNQKKLGSGFLSSLPAPKGRDNRYDGSSSFAKSLVPPSVAKKSGAAPLVPKLVAAAPKVVEDSDDDDDEPTDFFGFSSAPQRREEPQISEVPFMAMNSSMDVVGPSRPTEDDEVDPTQMYRNPEEEMDQSGPSASDQWLHRKISDEQAHKLLMRFSHDIGPEERRSINEMASSIVDVNVDSALGPDVRQNVIKNLGHRAFVEATSAPTPQVQTQGQMSRRKHQITYLASLAVAREEQLKDQWAEQKQSKRMARQKYGF